MSNGSTVGNVIGLGIGLAATYAIVKTVEGGLKKKKLKRNFNINKELEWK